MAKRTAATILCVRIVGSEPAVRAFLSKYPMQAEFHKREGNAIVLEAFVPERVGEEIKGRELQVEVLYDAGARGRERQKEVGRGNRFTGDQRIPQGLGVKTREGPR